jgi:hypothetical protein
MVPTERQLGEALNQLVSLRLSIPIYLRSYSLAGFVALANVLGRDTVSKALQKRDVIDNAVMLDVGGLLLYYYPKSLQCNETVVLDADGQWRLPFCVAHTLEELQRGVSTEGEDLSHFTIAPLSAELDVASTYARSTETWWKAMGKKSFDAERAAVERILG